MREVNFYKTADGKCPVAEYLRSLPSDVRSKITKVFEIIKNMAVVPKNYFKHLAGTEFYECRVEFTGNTYRLLGFFYGERLIILTNGFMKKTQKTPRSEIEIAKKRLAELKERGLDD